MKGRIRHTNALGLMTWVVVLIAALSACQGRSKQYTTFEQPLHDPAAGSSVSMLPGFEFSQRLQTNVATIWIEARSESGTGFIVGQTDEALYLVTAYHVVGGAGTEVIEVTFCADPDSAAAADIVWRAIEDDLAILRVARRANHQTIIEVIAPQKTVVTGEKVWFIGRGDKCIVPPNEGRILETRGFDNRLIIDAPIAGGGSSGAPSVTGFGIMGMLLEDIGLRRGSDRSGAEGFQRIKVLDIDRIREIVTNEAGVPWTLEDARNLPPESWQAARHNIATTLNDYLFNLQNVHEYLNRGWAKPDELRRIIPAYNRSYKKYYQQRTVHRAAVSANWGDSVEMRFVRIQEAIQAIHSEILSLNTYREQLYKAAPSLPDEVMRVVQAIQPKIDALVQDYTGFQRLLVHME